MSNQAQDIELADQSWKTKALVIGGVVGALVGVASAFMYINNRQEEGPPKVTAGEGVRLAVLVFGLLRSIANL